MSRPSFVAWGVMVAMGFGAACHRPKERPPKPRPEQDAVMGAPDAANANERWLTPAQVSGLGLVTTVAKVGLAPSPVTVSGRLTFDDLQVAHVVPPVNGHVTRVMVQQGQHVRSGEPLAHILSPNLGQIVADAESSHADFLAAQRNLARSQALFADHAVAQKDLEAAERRHSEAKAEWRRAQDKSALLGGKSGSSSDLYVVRSPIDGNIIVRNVTQGSDVQGQYENGPSAPVLFTVGSLQSVWALADVFTMDVEKIQVGAATEVSVVAYPGEVFAGHVDWVAPGPDPDSRATHVRCRLDNPGHKLKPEMFFTMVVAGPGQSGVVVPTRAVFYLQNSSFVFVKDPKPGPKGSVRFVRRKVVVQEDNGGAQVAITRGLADGEEVVSRGGILLTQID